MREKIDAFQLETVLRADQKVKCLQLVIPVAAEIRCHPESLVKVRKRKLKKAAVKILRRGEVVLGCVIALQRVSGNDIDLLLLEEALGRRQRAECRCDNAKSDELCQQIRQA